MLQKKFISFKVLIRVIHNGLLAARFWHAKSNVDGVLENLRKDWKNVAVRNGKTPE